jgi:hypothetical protein
VKLTPLKKQNAPPFANECGAKSLPTVQTVGLAKLRV